MLEARIIDDPQKDNLLLQNTYVLWRLYQIKIQALQDKNEALKMYYLAENSAGGRNCNFWTQLFKFLSGLFPPSAYRLFISISLRYSSS